MMSLRHKNGPFYDGTAALNTKPKRGFTWEEHQKIITSEKNQERRLYYVLLWEIGAAQSDAANLTSDNVDWGKNVLFYQRQKTGACCYLTVGPRLKALLMQLHAQGFLFPNVVQMQDKDRAAEFRRRCRLLKIDGVSLHSYRYTWTERARIKLIIWDWIFPE